MKHWRWLAYRCIETLLNLDTPADFLHSLTMLDGEEALVDGKERFFGSPTFGLDMEGSAIHGKLLAADDKFFVPVNKH